MYFSTTLLIVFSFVFSLMPVFAQAGSDTLVGVQDSSGIKFYAINEAGAKTQVGGLPPNFLVGIPDQSQNWFIRYQDYLTPSSNQEFIAFTAQQGEEGRLFLYSVAQNQIVKQVDIPLCLKPIWSPDDTGVLLTIYCGQEHTQGGIDYVYEVASDQLQPLDSTEEDAAQFQWLADSSGFLYENGGDLFVIARDGVTTNPLHRLTDLRSQTPEGTFRSICDPVWSAANERYYYVVGCIGGAERAYEYIYSVDLAGDNRNESIVSLPNLYPTEVNMWVYGLQTDPDSSDVYIILGSEDGSEYSDGLVRWRILRLGNPGEITPVYEEHIEQFLNSSLMSKSGDFIALLSPATGQQSDGLLKVVNLDNGQVAATVNIAPSAICGDAQWIDDTDLSYTVDPSGVCDIVFSAQPIQTWQLDITTGATTEVTGELAGTSWLLPIQPVMGEPSTPTP